MINIHPICAFDDNYIWALCDREKGLAYVVDPGQPEPVLDFLAQQHLELGGILITHHHWDHTNGVAPLLQRYPQCSVFGPQNSPFAGVQHPLQEGDVCNLTELEISFKILATPGHTLDHICYYQPQMGWLFCGDTLFSGGCGRLFEGTPQQMHDSLQKLAALPSQTQVFCTHEYTQANLKFAKAVEPDNSELASYSDWVDTQRANNAPSLPSSIERELEINPFLRAHIDTISQYSPATLKLPVHTTEERFALLRKWKDNF